MSHETRHDTLRQDLHAHVRTAPPEEIGKTLDALQIGLEHRAGVYAPLVGAALEGIRTALRRAAGEPAHDRASGPRSLRTPPDTPVPPVTGATGST